MIIRNRSQLQRRADAVDSVDIVVRVAEKVGSMTMERGRWGENESRNDWYVQAVMWSLLRAILHFRFLEGIRNKRKDPD